MALIFALALLSASVLPIYSAFMLRAYESEMVKAMSCVKQVQDIYHSEHGYYAGRPGLRPVKESMGKELSTEALPKSKYVDYENLLLSVNHPQNDKFLLLWILDDTQILGKNIENIAMDHEGKLYREGERESGGDWLPDYPHLETK
ncbi:MAG: hypothetical protein ACOCQP_00140 [Lentisphaeria bacterium]